MLQVFLAIGKPFLTVGIILTAWLVTTAAPANALAPTGGQPIDPRAFATCAQLPPHTDLKHLTDSQLIAYGLPTHIALDPELAQWEKVLASAPRRVCAKPTPLGFSVSHPHLHASLGAQQGSCNPPAPGSSCPGNWDGKEVLGSGGTLLDSSVDFNTPQVGGTINDFAAFWTGVGGDDLVVGSGAVLVQDGVITTVTTGGQYNESFVEVAPNVGAYNLPLCRLSKGDHVHAYAESNLNNDGYDYFYILNVSANCSNTCFVHTTDPYITDTCGFAGGPSYNTDGTTGECIAEWPMLSNGRGYPYGPPDLARWNPNNNSDLRFQPCDVNGSPLGWNLYYSPYINDAWGNDVADSGSLSNNDTFDVYWHRPY